MTLTTIIAIVLGVVVLVLLVFGFSTGWKNLWSRVTIYGAGSENTATIVQSCALSCSSGDKYGFCNQERRVIIRDGYVNDGVTCKQLSLGPVDFKKSSDKSPVKVSNMVAPCSTLC